MESPSGTNSNGSEGGGWTNQTTTALITIPLRSPEVPLSSPAGNSQSRRSCTHETKFKCGVCEQQFVFYCLLKRHLKDEHGIDSAFGCRFCRKTFSSHPRLYAHRKLAHSRASIQQQTSYQLATSSDPEKYDEEEPSSSISLAVPDVDEKGESLHGIETTKTGNVCICGRDFTQRRNLIRHIRRITEKWNCICTICKNAFFHRTELRRHMKLAHKVNFSKDNKTFGCARCGDEFKNRSELYRHVELAHEGKDEQQGDNKPDVELSTSGNFGESSSNNQRSLSTPRKRWIQHHQQVQHGKDASRVQFGHFCLCGTEFKSSRYLNRHVWYQTKERNVRCLLCPRHFVYPCGLKTHMKKVHPAEKDEMKLTSS